MNTTGIKADPSGLREHVTLNDSGYFMVLQALELTPDIVEDVPGGRLRVPR